MHKTIRFCLVMLLLLSTVTLWAGDKKKKAKKYKEDLATVLNRLDQEAHAALAAKEYAKAISLFDERIGICDQYPVAHYWKGVIALSQKDQATAKSEFLEAIELDPFYADPYLRLTGIAQAEKNMDDMTKYGRRFLALAPDHGKAAAVASIFGLENRGGLWATEAEAKAVADYASGWQSQGFADEQEYQLAVSGHEKSIKGNIIVDPASVFLWDNIPSALLTYRQTYENRKGKFVKVTTAKVLVQGKSRAVIYSPSSLNQDLSGGNQGLSRSIHTVLGAEIQSTTFHAEELAGKFFQEKFLFAFNNDKKFPSNDTKALWGGITAVKEKEVRAQLVAESLPVIPIGHGKVNLGGTSQIIYAHLLTRSLEDDLLEIHFAGVRNHHTGGEFTNQFKKIHFRHPLSFTKVKISKQEKTNIKLESGETASAQLWKVEGEPFWIASSGQLLKTTSGIAELELITPPAKGK